VKACDFQKCQESKREIIKELGEQPPLFLSQRKPVDGDPPNRFTKRFRPVKPADDINGMALFYQRFRFPPNTHFRKGIIILHDHTVSERFFGFGTIHCLDFFKM
jgi:hypothetical protein